MHVTILSAHHSTALWSATHFDLFCADWEPWLMVPCPTRMHSPFVSIRKGASCAHADPVLLEPHLRKGEGGVQNVCLRITFVLAAIKCGSHS